MTVLSQPISGQDTNELSLKLDTSYRGKTIRLPLEVHTSYCINLYAKAKEKFAKAFKKNNEAFRLKRTDVFKKRRGILGVGENCLVKLLQTSILH